MQRVVSCLVAIVWGLWLGGLGTLFLAVGALFNTLEDRRVAGTGASGVFRLFERYQLILAAAGLVLILAWRVLGGAPRLKTGLFGLFALATLLAVSSTLYITPRIEAMRQEGTTTGQQFKQLHGVSSTLYTCEAALLLIGGFLLPSAIVRDVRRASAARGGEGAGRADLSNGEVDAEMREAVAAPSPR
jgi:hypothetical protein